MRMMWCGFRARAVSETEPKWSTKRRKENEEEDDCEMLERCAVKNTRNATKVGD